MKGISNLLGLLMVAVITIAIFLAVSGVVGGFLARQTPKGSDLVLMGFVWWWEFGEDGKTIIDIKGNAVDVGSEAVNITGVYVVIGGTKYGVEYFGPRVVRPNNVAEIVGCVHAPVPRTSLLTVEVEWCSAKICSMSVTDARVSSLAYVINKDVYAVTTVTLTSTVTPPLTTTTTETVTTTVTMPATTTTITMTTTATQTVTATTTATATATVTSTTTTTTLLWFRIIPLGSCHGLFAMT